jgi:hypothetical protein
MIQGGGDVESAVPGSSVNEHDSFTGARNDEEV